MSTRNLIKKVIPISILGLILLILLIFLIFPISGKLVCKNKGIPGEMVAKSTYEVDFSFRTVNTIKIKQVVTSSDKERLDNYNKSLENLKKSYDKNKNYDSKIIYEDNKITYTVKINYKNIKNKREYIGKIKNNYEKDGAVCKYK